MNPPPTNITGDAELKWGWLSDGIERISKTFSVPLTTNCDERESRDAATLVHLIQHIQDQLFTVTAGWYLCEYQKQEYTHHQINHSEDFVDSE